MVIPVPLPVFVAPSGNLVKVQTPDPGNPLKATLPVDMVQPGWVITPTFGTVGVPGAALMVILVDTDEVHPSELVTL